MKKFMLFIAAMMLSFVSASAQNTENKVEEARVFDVVEQMPEFPGGQTGLMQYLSQNLKYPAIAEENGIQGRVICDFVVERDGQVTDVKVIKAVDPSLDNEAVRVIQAMPKWKPGKQDGKPVRVKYALPISFKLPPKPAKK